MPFDPSRGVEVSESEASNARHEKAREVPSADARMYDKELAGIIYGQMVEACAHQRANLESRIGMKEWAISHSTWTSEACASFDEFLHAQPGILTGWRTKWVAHAESHPDFWKPASGPTEYVDGIFRMVWSEKRFQKCSEYVASLARLEIGIDAA